MRMFIIMAVTALLMTSCAQQITRGDQYAKMYEEKPMAIVVMPPINQTTHVEAKDYFYTTLYTPLCEKGYYVYSPMLTMDMFQTESAYDAEQFIEADLSQFRNILGADAAIFTIIKSWKRNNLGGTLTAGVEYIMRSTKTGETLYKTKSLPDAAARLLCLATCLKENMERITTRTRRCLPENRMSRLP